MTRAIYRMLAALGDNCPACGKPWRVVRAVYLRRDTDGAYAFCTHCQNVQATRLVPTAPHEVAQCAS